MPVLLEYSRATAITHGFEPPSSLAPTDSSEPWPLAGDGCISEGQMHCQWVRAGLCDRSTGRSARARPGAGGGLGLAARPIAWILAQGLPMSRAAAAQSMPSKWHWDSRCDQSWLCLLRLDAFEIQNVTDSKKRRDVSDAIYEGACGA